ncbi:MAG: GNAT family N-acetyltransferase [Candidatus Marinimicrobia bacterium]|nr:GNAT family N-acetyltransferase [Candidatus Neomarinimicrobiota bacterium]
MIREYTAYYLEITDPNDVTIDQSISENIQFKRLTDPLPLVNQSFYLKIGSDWNWIDRKFWTIDQWQAYANQTELETWIVHYDGLPAGYFELLHEPKQTVQIAYLGLFSEYTGKGIGKFITGFAIHRAFTSGAKRVWLSTCSLDHPAALKTYLKCGFKIVRDKTVRKDFPEK